MLCLGFLLGNPRVHGEHDTRGERQSPHQYNHGDRNDSEWLAGKQVLVLNYSWCKLGSHVVSELSKCVRKSVLTYWCGDCKKKKRLAFFTSKSSEGPACHPPPQSLYHGSLCYPTPSTVLCCQRPSSFHSSTLPGLIIEVGLTLLHPEEYFL